MKLMTTWVAGLLICCLVTNAHSQNSKMDSVSYSLGVLIGNNLKQQGFNELNFNELTNGLKDVLSGTPKIDMAACNTVIRDYSMQREAKAKMENETKFKANKEAGLKFLQENKSKPGVVTLPSGLQYMVMKEGTGPKPTASSKVSTHYHGTLISGAVFDSSVERGSPATFGVNQVIKGWTEALQLMPVGSKWKLFIPSDLAYGDRGAGGAIEPYSTLIFEVELLSIEP